MAQTCIEIAWHYTKIEVLILVSKAISTNRPISPVTMSALLLKKILKLQDYFSPLLPTVSSNKRQRNHWDVPSHGYPGDSLCLHKWKPHGWRYAFQVDDYFPAENVHRWGPGYEPTGRWACSFCGVDINKDLNNTFNHNTGMLSFGLHLCSH